MRTHRTVAREYVGLGIATRMTGLGGATILRLALLGELAHTISPDRRPMFAVKDLEQLRSKVVAPQVAGA